MPSYHPQEKRFLYISSCVDQREGVLLCMLVGKRGLHSTLLDFALLPFPVSGSNQLSVAKTHLLTKQ